MSDNKKDSQPNPTTAKSAGRPIPDTIQTIAERFDQLAKRLRKQEKHGASVSGSGKVIKEAILATFNSASSEDADRVVEQLLVLLSHEQGKKPPRH